MYARTYVCASPIFWTFREQSREEARIERLTFHIEQGDYFPFLATILGFLKENLVLEHGITGSAECMKQQEFIEDTQKDLLYLQRHYTITPKEHPTSYTDKKMIEFTQ